MVVKRNPLYCYRFFLVSVTVLCMYDNDIYYALLSALDLGMIDGRYLFIVFDADKGKCLDFLL